ncbi:MAG: hypothetical protein KatS3mg111_2699 [Pirellulaceae bacterium]|nr:MAG: hypothetical protein KatS3mg111_2699 [Pirellulaceae bacterium]
MWRKRQVGKFHSGQDVSLPRCLPTKGNLPRATVTLASLLVLSGCAIGHPGFLDDYATVGGKWERTDPVEGRVGSIFSDPAAAEAFADKTQSTEEVKRTPRPTVPPAENAPAQESSTYYDDPHAYEVQPRTASRDGSSPTWSITDEEGY